jgi:hypothetical protein
MKTWRDRESTRAHYSQKGANPLSVDGQDPAGIALTVSKRLIAIFKSKRLLNIEAGLEMMALGLIICSMVCNFDIYLDHLVLFCRHKNGGRLPESPGDVKNVLSRFEFFLSHYFAEY